MNSSYLERSFFKKKKNSNWLATSWHGDFNSEENVYLVQIVSYTILKCLKFDDIFWICWILKCFFNVIKNIFNITVYVSIEKWNIDAEDCVTNKQWRIHLSMMQMKNLMWLTITWIALEDCLLDLVMGLF